YFDCGQFQCAGPVRHDRKLARALAVQPGSVVACLRLRLVRVDVGAVRLFQLQLRKLLEAQPLRPKLQGAGQWLADARLGGQLAFVADTQGSCRQPGVLPPAGGLAAYFELDRFRARADRTSAPEESARIGVVDAAAAEAERGQRQRAALLRGECVVPLEHLVAP